MSLHSKPLFDDLLTHYRELRRFLVRKLNNGADAEDIAQSSFEQALQVMRRTDGAGVESPRALLFRVAHNLCVDHFRHARVKREWADLQGAAWQGRAAPGSDYVVAYRQLAERLVAQLLRLPARRRDVFLLFRAYGMSRAEIAAQLGISEAAVAKHVVRATLDCASVFADLRAELPDEAASHGTSGTAGGAVPFHD